MISSKLTDLLTDFIDAYNFESSGTIKDLVPSMTSESLTTIAALWRQNDSHKLSYSGFRVTTIEADTATATCQFTETNSKNGSTSKTLETVTLRFVRVGEGWAFSAVPWPRLTGRYDDTSVER